MLSDEQLEEVRFFFESDAGKAMFAMLEASCMAEWISASDTAVREECWQRFQVISRLQSVLRDAPAMKRLSQRAQERRLHTTG